jgi:hypothetical protein
MGKPPSWNEIRTNATAFATRWSAVTDENAEAQTFWNEFLGIFGIDRKRFASFEARAKRTSTGGRGRIDLFWPGTLVAEHKSAGKDLAHAEEQALDYLDSIDVDNFPGVIITSDFANIRIRDLGGDNQPYTFPLEKLAEEIDRFGFIAGYQKRKFGDAAEVEANIQAAKLMGALYEELARTGYEGHDASVLMTRLLFLMFGDDTGMWEKGLFGEFIDTRTNADGSDLGAQLAFLFQILDKPETSRPGTMDELLARFPYVNGHLFTDRIDIPAFDRRMRDELVKCTEFDWSKISPAVFGSLFQAVKSKEARRTLGEHYTTEHNIMRALAPLFLDDLWEEYQSIKDNASRLDKFHDKLANIKVMDPACGCGNFLVIAFRELRRLELATLTRLQELRGDVQLHLDVSTMVRVTLNNFYGIEIEEWPARIAETAMFLVDQQANHELARAFGNAPDRLPIMQAVKITIGNALRVDWNSVLPAAECSYIVGNPPFIGKQARSEEQQQDMDLVFDGWPSYGNLDYVAGWYAKAGAYMRESTTRASLVSTSSICQGEQVELLWGPLFRQGIELNFAHRQFHWTSEAAGAAGVTVIIVGFSHNRAATKKKIIFDYPDEKQPPVALEAAQIGPYLAPGAPVVVTKRRTPLAHVPAMSFGSMPNDGGHLILSDEQVEELRKADPVAAKYIRVYYGAQELIEGWHRWCLWPSVATPDEIAGSKYLRQVADSVRSYRESSSRAATRALAAYPLRFGEVRQPSERYLAVPRVSSENRRYLPTAFFESDVVASDALLTITGSDDYLFGIISSSMFITWLASVGGRLRKDFRMSAEIVYNNFPFPEAGPNERARVEDAAQRILDLRTSHGSSLASLYGRASMPEDLTRAHLDLDRAVDALFGKKVFATGAERLETLLTRYAELVAADKLFSDTPEKKTRKKKTT